MPELETVLPSEWESVVNWEKGRTLAVDCQMVREWAADNLSAREYQRVLAKLSEMVSASDSPSDSGSAQP